MASAPQVKPTHKAVKTYYAALATYADQNVEHEGALRSAFQNLLSETGRKVGWTLIPELSLNANGRQIRPDGTFRDEFTIERGYWEAKDTREARLYQDAKLDMIADLRDPQQLCDLLNAFFSHTEPAHEDFNKAVDEFKQRVPDLARGLSEASKAPRVVASSTPAVLILSCLPLTTCKQKPNIVDMPSAARYYCNAGTDGRRAGCARHPCCTDANRRLGYPPHMVVISSRGPHGVVGVDLVRVTG